MGERTRKKKTMAEKIPVLYCVDGKEGIYLTLLKMSMHSFMDNCPSAVFYVIYDNIPEEDLTFIRENFPVRFFKFPQERFKEKMKVLTKDTDVVHPSIFWRLFAAEILPKNVDQILHIDSDILLCGELGLPEIQNLKENLISAFNGYVGCPSFRKECLARYGVAELVLGTVNWLNLPLMRSFNFLEKCVTLAEKDRTLRYEEDLMSIITAGRIEFYDPHPTLIENVFYRIDANASPSFSLLHFVFFKRHSGSLIHPKFKKIFNHYYKKVTGSSWDFHIPFYLLPFKFVPYKARGWFLSIFFGHAKKKDLCVTDLKNET